MLFKDAFKENGIEIFYTNNDFYYTLAYFAHKDKATIMSSKYDFLNKNKYCPKTVCHNLSIQNNYDGS